MSADIFGDLQEWGRVLETLDRARRSGTLDEHQAGLARILRYRDNWRLIDEVLQVATEIRQASDLLIAEVCNILVLNDLHVNVRVRAARALGHLLAHRPQQPSNYDPERTIQTMRDVAAVGCPPLLAAALQEAVKEARG